MQIKLLIIAAFALAACVAIISWQKGRIDRLREEREQAITFAATESNTTEFYKNKADRETARAGVLELSLRNTRELIENERLNFVRQFDGVNRRLNNLEQVSHSTAQVVASWKLPLRDTIILNLDSTRTPAKFFTYTDSLNHISGIVSGTEIIPRIQITVPLQGAVFWQRKKFLGLRIGRKRWYSDITSTNPNVRITKHEFIKVKKRR